MEALAGARAGEGGGEVLLTFTPATYLMSSPPIREYRISTDLPFPPFEEPTDLMLDVIKPEFESTYQTLHEVHFWAAGWSTQPSP